MKPNILLVDDDPSAIQLMSRILADEGDLRFASDGQAALRLAHDTIPDLMLLDAEMPGMNGFQLCETIKSDPLLADVPIIFVTSHREAEFEVTGFELGAADFIAKPISAPLVLARVKTQLRVKQMTDELRRVSTIDSLTGVANRRRFDESLAGEWLRAQREGAPLSLLLIDIDHFKLFNDRYGHPAGDVCLQLAAHAIESVGSRPGDLVARYGGEEFALLLPRTPRIGAEHVAHMVLDAIEALAIPHAASLSAKHVTVSVGVSCYDDTSPSWVEPSPESRFGNSLRPQSSAQELLAAADKALYAAKRAGRAQAGLLDIADVDTPELVREISPLSRQRRTRQQG